MKAIDPRETEEYKNKMFALSEYSDTKIVMAAVCEMLKDMKYKNALDNPSRTIKPEEYCLLDEMRKRL